MTGLDAILDDLNRMKSGVCPACGSALPPLSAFSRRAFTCSEHCHRLWIERLIAKHGETRRITHAETGKVYLVPTRVILEQGIRGSDLPNYPEARA